MPQYKSAKYIKFQELDGTVTTNKHVVATDANGRDYYIPVPHEECVEYWWLQYTRNGGQIAPYKA